MMYITVNEHRLVARRPGCRDSGFLPLTVQCKWPGTITRLVAASQIAGTGPKRRSLASPDRLALLTQSYRVTANVTKDSPLTTWHLKVRSLSSRMVRRPGCRELQMAGRQRGGGHRGGKAVCLPVSRSSGLWLAPVHAHPTPALWSRILAL